MKETYKRTELEVIEFNEDDILRTSDEDLPPEDEYQTQIRGFISLM